MENHPPKQASPYLHPEHYHLDNREFIALCMENNLMPFNQITFEKKEAVSAKNSNHQPSAALHPVA